MSEREGGRLYSTLNSTRVLTVVEFEPPIDSDTRADRTHTTRTHDVLTSDRILCGVCLLSYPTSVCKRICWPRVSGVASKIHSSLNLSRFDDETQEEEEGKEEFELIDIDTIESHSNRYDSTSSNSSSEMADAGTPLITHGERLLSSSSSSAAAAGDGYPTPLEYRTAGSATSPPERGSGRDTHKTRESEM